MTIVMVFWGALVSLWSGAAIFVLGMPPGLALGLYIPLGLSVPLGTLAALAFLPGRTTPPFGGPDDRFTL